MNISYPLETAKSQNDEHNEDDEEASIFFVGGLFVGDKIKKGCYINEKQLGYIQNRSIDLKALLYKFGGPYYPNSNN